MPGDSMMYIHIEHGLHFLETTVVMTENVGSELANQTVVYYNSQ